MREKIWLITELPDIQVAAINFDSDTIASLAGTNTTENGIAKGHASGNLTLLRGAASTSQLGRFSQADTVTPGGVQGLDRYAGMANNPLRYFDPTGHASTECESFNECEGSTQPAPGVDEEQHKRLRALQEEAELLSTLMQLGRLTDVEALARLMEFAAPLYLMTGKDPLTGMEVSMENVTGFLTDLGIVVGDMDATGFIPREMMADNPLNQYYVGYAAFDPDGPTTGFVDNYNPHGHNQIRHFLAGAAGLNKTGLPGMIYARWQEDAPEDDLVYGAAMTYVLFQYSNPLGFAGNWVRENLAK